MRKGTGKGRHKMANRELIIIEEPRIARLLFADIRFAWLWLALRLYLGWAWWQAGWSKFVDPKWINGGQGLLEYWQRGLTMRPKPVIAVDWYRSFIEFLVHSEAHTWLSKVIIFGELAIALGLILGAFTGLAAFFGGMMNWNFIMAGSAFTNGMLFAMATWLVLAWRMPDGSGLTAGYCLWWARRGNAVACFAGFEPRKQLEWHRFKRI